MSVADAVIEEADRRLAVVWCEEDQRHDQDQLEVIGEELGGGEGGRGLVREQFQLLRGAKG